MKNKKAYIFIILGAIIALSRYAFNKEYDQFLLIGGVMLLMIGIYNISKSLPSKKEEDFTPPLVQSGKIEEKNKEEVKII